MNVLQRIVIGIFFVYAALLCIPRDSEFHSVLSIIPYYEQGVIEIRDNRVYNTIEGSVKSIFVTLHENIVERASSHTRLNEGEIVLAAKRYIGVPYRENGKNDNGFDCDGLVYRVFRECGYNMPRTMHQQYEKGRSIVKIEELESGDLVFFSDNSNPEPAYVGIYVGNNKTVFSSSRFGRVVSVSLNSEQYVDKFICGKRVIN